MIWLKNYSNGIKQQSLTHYIQLSIGVSSRRVFFFTFKFDTFRAIGLFNKFKVMDRNMK